MKPEDVNLLTEALPYINKFDKKTFVIKMGGEIVEHADVLYSFCEEVALLSQVGIRIVVVHGGGKQATELSEKLGVVPMIIHGRRVTDEDTLDIVKMVFAGKLNIEILGAFTKAGVKCVGLSGVDGGMIQATKRPPQKVKDEKTGEIKEVDFGFVGDITSVDTSLIETLIGHEFIPVISSLATDTDGNLYNINADTVASAIATKLKAEKLILASAIDGIYDSNKKIISRIDLKNMDKLVEQRVITGGMIPKVKACESAIQDGVKSVHIINGTKEGSLLAEIFTETGCGTMIFG